METQWFDRGWSRLEDDGRQAREMELRSRLLMNLQQGISDKGWNRDHACRWLDLPGARVDALLAGKIGAFSLRDLVTLMEQADIHWRVSTQDRALLDHLIREQQAGVGACKMSFSPFFSAKKFSIPFASVIPFSVLSVTKI